MTNNFIFMTSISLKDLADILWHAPYKLSSHMCRCMNGGTCLDGVDNFTCSCPPQLTGQFCECLITGTGQLNCSYILPSSTTLLPSPPAITEVPSTLTWPAVIPTGLTTEETTITSQVTTYVVPSSPTSPSTSETTSGDIYSYSTTSSSLSSKFTTSFDETLVTETTTSNFTGTISTEMPSTTSSIFTLTTSEAVSTPTEEIATTKIETVTYPFLTESKTPLTTSEMTESRPAEESSPTERTQTPEVLTLYSNVTEVSASTPFPEKSSTSIATVGISSEIPSIVTSEEITLRSETSTSASPTSTEQALSTEEPLSEQPLTPQSTVSLLPYPVTVVTEEVPSQNITITEQVTTVVNTELSSEYPTTFFLTTSPRTPEMTPTSTLTPTETTPVELTSDRYTTSTELPDCTVIPCHNGGTCIHTKDGPQVSALLSDPANCQDYSLCGKRMND